MMKFFRRFKDLRMEGAQAKLYDKSSRELRIEDFKKDASEVAKHIKDGDCILEIGIGPGYLSIEIAKFGNYKITGIDISNDCVEIAAKNAKERGVDVNFQQGNASQLPFEANSFNFIVCVLTFKNFKESVKSLNEMYKVLKPGGTALIMDLNKNASKQSMKTLVNKMGLKGFDATLALAIQRSVSYTRKEFEAFISQTEFKEFTIKETGLGFSIYLNKNDNMTSRLGPSI